MVKKNNIIRYMDPDIHHYLVRYPNYNIVTKVDQLSKHKTDNFAYLVDWNPTDENLHRLRQKIDILSKLCERIFVNFGEPSFNWNYPWEDTSKLDCRIYDTADYINSFDQDNLVFFANCLSRKKLKHPFYFVNDMFFYGNELYLTNERCIKLLELCDKNKTDKRYKWECMFSWSEHHYKMFTQHPVDAVSLSTCRALGITSYGDAVQVPDKKGAETFTTNYEDRNVRTSDLIDPSIYNDSWYSLAVETNKHNDVWMFSEKEAKPIMAKRLFAMVGGAGQIVALKKLGFESFGEVFDESFDDEFDEDKRFKKLMDSMQHLAQEDPDKIYEKIKPILEHNYNHFISRHWNRDFISSWESPIAWCQACDL